MTSHDAARKIANGTLLGIEAVCIAGSCVLAGALFLVLPIVWAVGGNPLPLIIVGVLALVVTAYFVLDWWGDRG